MSVELPRIPQMEPTYGEGEIRAVGDYMRGGGWLTEHVRTRQFERELAAFVGAKHCIAMSNGTVSLVAMLLALGIGPGDEVVVPTFTMIASANAVTLTGAFPVLVDVDPRTLCAGVEQISPALTARTKAVMAVSLNGRGPDLVAIERWCQGNDVTLVEDAAQSFGSRLNGRHLGTFGRAGSYSFSPHKIITTGQGGAVVTDDELLAERIRMIKDFGRRASGTDVHDIIGYNFKLTDLQAAIGLEQLKGIDARIARKKAMFARYRDRLARAEDVVRFVPTDLIETTPWFVDVLVEDRTALRGHLDRHRIETRAFYPAIHMQPAYRNGQLSAISFQPSDISHERSASSHQPSAVSHQPSAISSQPLRSCPVAELVSEQGLWLPSSLKLTDSDIDRVCSTVLGFYGKG